LLKAQALLRSQQTQVPGLFGIPVSVATNNNALGRALSGADLSTQAGRDAFDAVLRDLYEQLRTLTSSELAGFLGDLTSSEFIEALKQIEALVDNASAADPSNQTVGFAVSRTITEVTGERITALLGTANYWAEETARNTAAIAANTAATNLLLGGGVLSAESIDRELAGRASIAARNAGNLLVG
jgi:hypothetical protein